MRKTHKRILGFLSLGFVAAITVFAATLPTPEAKATSSFTDTITITVVGRTVDVRIDNPKNDTVLVNPVNDITVHYERTDTVTITGQYENEDGEIETFNIDHYTTTELADDQVTTFNVTSRGYGIYTITAIGEVNDDEKVTDTDIITFKYIPVDLKIDPDPTPIGDIPVDLVYDGDNVCSIDLNVYLGNVLVAPPSPIHVEAPTTHVVIPLEKLENGKYNVVATAYDCPAPGEEPKPLPFPSTDTFDVDKKDDGGDEEEEEDIDVPDTGGFFMGTNISKTDYLATALIMFFAFALLALGIVAKGKRNNKRR